MGRSLGTVTKDTKHPLSKYVRTTLPRHQTDIVILVDWEILCEIDRPESDYNLAS